MKCKECGDPLGGSIFDFDNFCYLCVLGLIVDGPGSPNYPEASGEYWQDVLDQNALNYPPSWKAPSEPRFKAI